jgi:hypothetical protein
VGEAKAHSSARRIAMQHAKAPGVHEDPLVRQVGNNRYSGSFYNSEYAISGVIHIIVRGLSQTVRLISGCSD